MEVATIKVVTVAAAIIKKIIAKKAKTKAPEDITSSSTTKPEIIGVATVEATITSILRSATTTSHLLLTLTNKGTLVRTIPRKNLLSKPKSPLEVLGLSLRLLMVSNASSSTTPSQIRTVTSSLKRLSNLSYRMQNPQSNKSLQKLTRLTPLCSNMKRWDQSPLRLILKYLFLSRVVVLRPAL